MDEIQMVFRLGSAMSWVVDKNPSKLCIGLAVLWIAGVCELINYISPDVSKQVIWIVVVAIVVPCAALAVLLRRLEKREGQLQKIRELSSLPEFDEVQPGADHQGSRRPSRELGRRQMLTDGFRKNS